MPPASQPPNGSPGMRKIASGVFKTPALPPPEEIKMLRLWEMLLALFEYEADVAAHSSDGHRLFETDSPALSTYLQNKESMVRPPTVPDPKRESRPRLVHDACWAMLKDDHPDEILARFLVQSKWDVELAFDRFVSALKRRSQELGIEELMTSGEEGMHRIATTSTDPYERRVAEGFCKLLRSGLLYSRGLDRIGRQICIARVRLHRRNAQPSESIKRYVLWQTETMRLAMPPSADTCVSGSDRHSTCFIHIDTGQIGIYDLTGVGMANFDFASARFLNEIFENVFPNALSTIIFHRAPKVFESVFTAMKTWMSDARIQKVRFTHTAADLEEYMARENIPKFLGGDDDFEFRYPEPEPDENIGQTRRAACVELLAERMRTTAEFERITQELILATREGAYNTPDIKLRRAKCVDKLRIQFWRLDPLVRARSFYDRWGIIRTRRKAALDAFKDEDISNRLLGVV